MLRKSKILSFLLCFCLLFEQTGFAQVAGTLDISGHLAAFRNQLIQDKFRPLHLRSLGYDNNQNNLRLLLDKGDLKNPKKPDLETTTKTLLNYFFVGVTLPNDTFWVNLRPDSENNIIDPDLATTDVGKILLEADLQLKKDTAKFTSPGTPEGKEYWEKLYQKAGELLGYENVTIPTLTRPWIVPGEIIIRETKDNAYIYKATLKVMLEQDYLKDSANYNFDDPRLRTLNEYSSQLIRDLIIPKLTKEVNISKRYAPLRQVYYSLILAQWFKSRFYGKGGLYSWLIDRRNLQGLTSKVSWSKTTYFKAYQKSFKDGEYNIQQPVYTPYGQTVRSYFSGGFVCNVPMPAVSSPRVAAKITEGPTEVTAISGDARVSSPLTDNVIGALAVGSNTMDPSETKVTITEEASSPSGLPAEGSKSGASSATSIVISNQESQTTTVSQASSPNLGAQVSYGKNLDHLSEALDYKLRFIRQRYRVFNASDSFYSQVKEGFNKLIEVLKANGSIDASRDYQLVLYDSSDVNAFYMVNSDYVFLSKGLLDELDQYLKSKGQAGITMDHVVGVLAHELRHSVQNFDSMAETWSQKKGDRRKKEYDADIEAIFLPDMAGYNPRAIIDVMDFFIFAENDSDLRSKMGRALADHPQSIDRRNKLASIIEDKNVLILNSEKSYQSINMPLSQDALSKVEKVASSGDLENFSGDIYEIAAMLYVLGKTNYQHDRNINGSAVISLLSSGLKEYLQRYIEKQYSHLTSAQRELLYELHFGFLDRIQFSEGADSDRLFENGHRQAVSDLLSQMSDREIGEVYELLSKEPPIYKNDLPSEVDKKTSYEQNYFTFIRAGFIRNLDLSLGLMANRLESRTILQGARNLMTVMAHYYERDIAGEKQFDTYWRSIAEKLSGNIKDAASLQAFIAQVGDMFRGNDSLKGKFCTRVLEHIFRDNSYFRSVSLVHQVEAISNLLNEASALRNAVLRKFWEERKHSLSMNRDDAIEALKSMIKMVDMRSSEKDRDLFWDETGVEKWYAGTSGIVVEIAAKSLYGELTKELFNQLKGSALTPTVQDVIDLFDNNIVLDYQDLMQLYGHVLEAADADAYLKVAEALSQFINRENLRVKEGDEYADSQQRIADYHDMFILAYFYKKQGIAFTFYRQETEKTVVDRRVENYREVEDYSKYQAVPLLLEVFNEGRGCKKMYSQPMTGRWAGWGWDFSWGEVLSTALKQNNFRPEFGDLMILRDSLLSDNSRRTWVHFFYTYANLTDSETIEFLPYFGQVEGDDTNPVAVGSNNPLSIVSVFRSIQLNGGRRVTSVGDRLSLALGFSLYGNIDYQISSTDELRSALAELDRYFPGDSDIKAKEAEKILIAFLSSATGLPYEKQGVAFVYPFKGKRQQVVYEGYRINVETSKYVPNEESSVRILEGFDILYDRLSPGSRAVFGKLIYGILRNNRSLTVFQSFDSHIDLINSLFRFYSKAKDDYIYEAIDEHDVTPDQYRKSILLTTRFAYEDNSKDVNQGFFGAEAVKESIRREPRDQRAKLLLWFITGKQEDKPKRIIDLERENNVNAAEMIDAFWGLTVTERQDVLEEILKGQEGLFEIDYHSDAVELRQKLQATKEALFQKIEENNVSSKRLDILRYRLAEWFLDYVIYNRPNDLLNDRQWNEKMGRYPFVGDDIKGRLRQLGRDRNSSWLETVSSLERMIVERIVPILKRLQIKPHEKDYDRIAKGMFNLSVHTFDDISEKSPEEAEKYIFEQLLYRIGERTIGRDLRHINQIKEHLSADDKDLILLNELSPVIAEIAKQYVAAIFDLIKEFNVFMERELPFSKVDTIYEGRKQAARVRVEKAFDQLNSNDNPSFREVAALLDEYGIKVSFEAQLRQFVNFENFIETLINSQIINAFPGEAGETLTGLLQIKFKYHSLERRVQFLNGLLAALHGKKNKGEIIIAIAQQSGVPVIKLMQLLAQRGIFIDLEEDKTAGEELNNKVKELQSNADPIQKATIFKILEEQGVLDNVDVLGRRLGAASIKQVHKLVLKNPIVGADGKERKTVALKVKRPSVLKHLEEDFDILGRALRYFNTRHPEKGVSADTLEKIRQTIMEELNFEQETNIQNEFKANLQGRKAKFDVPSVLPGGKSNGERLIILDEFVDAPLLRSLPSQEKTASVYYKIIDEFFKQVFVDGLYHADWHEGNQFVKDKRGILIDLGSSGRVPEGQRKVLFKIFEAVVRANNSQLVDALKQYGVSMTTELSDELGRVMGEALNNENRFSKVFLTLERTGSSMPTELLRFLQALSKVGKSFDHIGKLRSATLILKYKFLTTFDSLSSSPAQISNSMDQAQLSAASNTIGRSLMEEYTNRFSEQIGVSEVSFGGFKVLNNPKARAEVINNQIFINSFWLGKMTKDEIERVIANEVQHTLTDFLRDKKGLEIGGLHNAKAFQELQQRIGELYDKTIEEKGNVFAKTKSQYQEIWEVLSLLRSYEIYLDQIKRGIPVTTHPYEFIDAFKPEDLDFLNENYLFEITKDFEPETGQGTKITYEDLGYPKGHETNSDDKSSASSSIPDKKGGIDFRVLPIVNQQINMGILKLNPADLSRLNNINLDSEWLEIQNMVNAGIIPSNERIKEYVLASCLRQSFGNQINKVLGCIADIMRMEEDRVTDADVELKDMLVLIEAGKPEAELQCGLSQIKISPQEPKLVVP